MSLSPQFLDELRARTTLSSLVGKTVKITRAGREYKACCPFHNEKTPSFTINDEKGFYHCFGCGAHGDAIRWLTEQRGLSFMDAIKELSATAGMDVPVADPRAAKKAEEQSTLLEVMQSAQNLFVQQYISDEGSHARSYVIGRGFDEGIVKKFGIGFAPDARAKLKSTLEKKHPVSQLIESGMLISVDGKEPYDRFRGRLMIPIRDARGRVIAFGGRILSDGEPKYLNSPDTALFDKGRTLYNLDRASPASRKSGRLVAVEGYMDVIALAQAGIEDVVAPLGTALTENQMLELWKRIEVPILCFDGDAAGQKAARRAAERALPILKPGFSFAFASLPTGKDPDDVVRMSGRAGFENILSTSNPLDAVLYAHQRVDFNTRTPEGRAGLLHRLQQLSDSCQDDLVRQEYGRSFKDQFFNDFYWRRNHRDIIMKQSLATSPREDGFLHRMFVRSVLYGLIQFPTIIGKKHEQIIAIRMDHPVFNRWQDTLLEAWEEDHDLSDNAISEILLTADLSELAKFDLQKDLRFPWIRMSNGTHADISYANAQLESLIDFLTEEQHLNDEIEDLNDRIKRDFNGPSYERYELARQIVRERKMALYKRSAESDIDTQDFH